MKRLGDTLESGSTKDRKKEERALQDVGNATVPNHPKQAVNMEDYGIFAVDGDNFHLALLPGDIQNPID